MVHSEDPRVELFGKAMGMSGAGRTGETGGGARPRSWWVLAAMVLIGSSTATAAKFAVAELPTSLLPIVRFGGAGLALLPWVLGRGAIRRILREDSGLVIGAALLCVPINQGFFLNGTRYTPTTHVGLIYATCPIFVLMMAVAWRHERMSLARLLGVLVCVLGASVIALGGMGKAGPAGRSTLYGDLLLVGAVVSWAAYLTLNRRLLLRHPALPVLSTTFILGALFCVPFAAVSMHEWPLQLSRAHAPAWLGMLHLTLVASLVGLALQNVALRRFEASHVAAVGNLSPVLTVLWGVALLGESISPALVVGGLLTLGGVALASQVRPTAPSWLSEDPGRAMGCATPVAVVPPSANCSPAQQP